MKPAPAATPAPFAHRARSSAAGRRLADPPTPRGIRPRPPARLRCPRPLPRELLESLGIHESLLESLTFRDSSTRIPGFQGFEHSNPWLSGIRALESLASGNMGLVNPKPRIPGPPGPPGRFRGHFFAAPPARCFLRPTPSTLDHPSTMDHVCLCPHISLSVSLQQQHLPVSDVIM